MQGKTTKPVLNRLLESISKEGMIDNVEENQLNIDCNRIWREEPFAHIKNFSESLELLKEFSIWISYGGNRTGSTFTTMALKVLLGSLIENFLLAWEGDFKEPIKFFELVMNTPSIEGGILKIHRNEDFCNRMLNRGKSKAVVSIRDYPSIAASYIRMRGNPYSPFYAKTGTPHHQLVDFIGNQIEEHKKKQSLPHTLFIREDLIRERPQDAVLKIAKYMGLDLTNSSACVIGETLSIESQRIRQKSLVFNSTGHSHDSFLHHEHVNPASQESDEQIKDLVFTHFGDNLNDDGYLL